MPVIYQSGDNFKVLVASSRLVAKLMLKTRPRTCLLSKPRARSPSSLNVTRFQLVIFDPRAVLPQSTFGHYCDTIEAGSAEWLSTHPSSDVTSCLLPDSRARSGPTLLRTEVTWDKVRSAEADPYFQRRARSLETNSATWAYTKYGMLFFVTLLVTWVGLVCLMVLS